MTARRIFLAWLALAALAIGISAPAARADDRLVVFAAASLKNALDEINAAWADKTGEPAAISYAGSSALARQIEQGAPADIFISANLDWMQHLSGNDLTRRGSETRLLGNSLALIAPAGSDVTLTIAPGFALKEKLAGGRLAMAQADAVPAGIYGKAALEFLGVWDDIRTEIAQAENVRAALKLVSTGEAPLGIVYRTDAAADTAVRIVGTFPDESHPPIVYPAAILAASKNPRAEAFMAFLSSPPAIAAFERQGFTVIMPAQSN
ncbi:molybdate ABC transporter substrate-binding protein [Mesorhizobium xinjiangense]|uniref:molybdate ABC transporter substrate-binding protein n=1 Tax=Mesorhizobium xinjiangense TaxID=2678685 RepID=UPI001F2A6DD2|nr:molybdate ABC transporter substrate-binding protein [Mesorhizobium xinjiangense]